MAESASGAALERLIAEPVCPLVVAVLCTECNVVVLVVVDVVHEEIHRLPVLVDDTGVSELLPDGPWNDDSCIGPAKTHHGCRICAVLCLRSYTREAAQLGLGVAHVTHPLVEE